MEDKNIFEKLDEIERIRRDAVNEKNIYEMLPHMRGNVAEEYNNVKHRIEVLDFCTDFIKKYETDKVEIPFSKYFNLTIRVDISCFSDHAHIEAFFDLHDIDYFHGIPDFVPRVWLYNHVYCSYSKISSWVNQTIMTLCWPVFHDKSINPRSSKDVEKLIAFASGKDKENEKYRKAAANAADVYIEGIMSDSE